MVTSIGQGLGGPLYDDFVTSKAVRITQHEPYEDRRHNLTRNSLAFRYHFFVSGVRRIYSCARLRARVSAMVSFAEGHVQIRACLTLFMVNALTV